MSQWFGAGKKTFQLSNKGWTQLKKEKFIKSRINIDLPGVKYDVKQQLTGSEVMMLLPPWLISQ